MCYKFKVNYKYNGTACYMFKVYNKGKERSCYIHIQSQRQTWWNSLLHVNDEVRGTLPYAVCSMFRANNKFSGTMGYLFKLTNKVRGTCSKLKSKIQFVEQCIYVKMNAKVNRSMCCLF